MGLDGVGLYVRNSIEAVEMYKSAFGLELGHHVLNKDGGYFHSEMCLDGKSMFSVVEASHENGSAENIQLRYTFDDKDNLLHAFDTLSKDGKVTMDICELPWTPCAAEVMDKYGIRWYLTLPQRRGNSNS